MAKVLSQNFCHHSSSHSKVDFDDSVWIEVKGNAELYRFFKTTVEIQWFL